MPPFPVDGRTSPTVGDEIEGKYRVERVIGSGGMGVVVAARHLGLDELVAIKMMLPHALADTAAVQRFEREARAAVKIESEHIARIYDVGKLPNGVPYIVMEYLEGEDLSVALLKGALPTEAAADAVIQACDALHGAHALGIVHRDLKPANLFATRDTAGGTTIKILDFGISKADIGKHDITKSQSVVGTPYYMSPEQLRSPRDLDFRSDIWSLGVVLFELLTRRLPFEGETLAELILNIVTQPAPLVTELQPSVPPALSAVVARCLSSDRFARFGSVAELAGALAPFGSARTRAIVDRISLVPEPPMGARTQVLTVDPSGPLPRTRTRRRPFESPGRRRARRRIRGSTRFPRHP